MSDVNVTTAWTVTPDGDYEYNGVLGCVGYDTDNNRLFVSAQSPPNVAGNVRTEYARGFHMAANYNGDLISSPTENESAELKKVRFTMSFAGSSYDLTDARCYCQFQNHFKVTIATWQFLHVATDATETVIASGANLDQRDKIQIDFKNDYGAGQFIFEFTYESGTPKFIPRSGNWIQVEPRQTVTLRAGGETKYFVNESYTTQCWLCHASALPLSTFVATWLPISQGRISYRYGGQLFSTESSFYYDGNTYRYGTTSWNWHTDGVTADGESFPNSSFSSNNQACTEFYNGTWQGGTGGLNTTDFNNYDGKVYTCRLFANIANVAPGPMATESEGGTEGDFDTTSDSLDTPDLPAEGVTVAPRAGDLYLCSEIVLGNLQRQLFDSNIAGAIRDIFSNVPDCILSVMSFPLPASAYTVRFTSNIFAGGQDLGNTTVTNVIKRYIEYDCGTVNLHLFWDSALDLNPYTKLNIFIPGVGMRPLDADICMSHTIGLKYHIDLLTGVCVAFVTVDGDVYQQHTGNLGQQMAFSGTRNGQIMTGILSGLAGNASNVANMSNPISGASNLVATTLSAFKVPRTVIGNFGGSTAQLAVQQPYIEIERPIQQLPRDYTKYNAYPCYMTAQLINLNGWTEVQDIFIDDIDCTQSEMEELLNLLHNGVIL